MDAKIFLCLVVFVLIGCSESSANRRYEHLKEFEKYSPYPWTQWLRFHPSAASYAAVDDMHRKPPAVLIPPLDPAEKTSILPEDDDNDMLDDDDDDDDFDFSLWKRALSSPESKLSPALNLSFWTGTEIPSPIPPGYWAAKKSLFLSKLFDALAKAVINTTATEDAATPSQVLTPAAAAAPGGDGDDNDNVLLNEIERAITEDNDDDTNESNATGSSEEASTEATTTAPTMLDKKIDFLQHLVDIISTTPQPTTTTTKATKKPKEKKVKAAKTKKVKPESVATTTTPRPTTRAPGSLTYTDLAKMILNVDE